MSLWFIYGVSEMSLGYLGGVSEVFFQPGGIPEVCPGCLLDVFGCLQTSEYAVSLGCL